MSIEIAEAQCVVPVGENKPAYFHQQGPPTCPDELIGTHRSAGSLKRSFNCANQNRAVRAFGEGKPVPKKIKISLRLDVRASLRTSAVKFDLNC